MQTEQAEVKRRPGRPAKKAWDAAPAQGKRTTKAVHDDSIHASRAKDERAAVEVHDMQDEPWVNPVSLPYIKPLKGMVQRYIRVAVRGETDSANAARKFREGWVPRPVSTIPKNIPVPSVDSGKYAGCVGVEGMILCHMPVERNAARNKHFDNENKKQTAAINARLTQESQHHSSGFGKAEVERSTKVLREVAVAADE